MFYYTGFLIEEVQYWQIKEQVGLKTLHRAVFFATCLAMVLQYKLQEVLDGAMETQLLPKAGKKFIFCNDCSNLCRNTVKHKPSAAIIKQTPSVNLL